MNHYEILYIIHPALQAGHLDDTIKTVSEKIEHFKGKVLIQSNWGKKKLAYPIIKQKFGTYIFIQCTIDGIKINDLNSEFEHNANILRHLITKIEEEDIIEQNNLSEYIEKEKQVSNQDKNKQTDKETVENNNPKMDEVKTNKESEKNNPNEN